jgi:protein TonB
MFEQAVLSNGPASKRVWTTFAGITGQALLVTFAVMVPMIWPEAMPNYQLLSHVWMPSPPPAPPPPPGPQSTVARMTHVVRQFNLGVLTLPHRVPPVAVQIEDPPTMVASGDYGNGVFGGAQGGDKNGVVGSILTDLVRVTPAPPLAKPVVHASAATPEPTPNIIRVKQGGLVHLGPLVHRVEPRYPPLARQMRVEGVVELVGVVGIDGRIRELNLKGGHPLLAPAAIEAVRQWIYEPTTLNGDRVEIIAPITVTFRLN